MNAGSVKVKGFAAGIAAAVCYGTNPLGTLRLYAEGYNSCSVLIYRYALAVLMFAVVMMVRGETFRIKWGTPYALLFSAPFSPCRAPRSISVSATWRPA